MRKTHVVLTDDIDGTEEAVCTYTFGFEGTNYEIDLSPSNAGDLEDRLALFIGHARKVSTKKARSTSSASKGRGKAIREWAISQGIDVGERGRLQQEVIRAYDVSHAAS